MSSHRNHKNLITALLIVAIVTIFGYVAYLAVYNVRVLNEIQSNLTQGEAAKGGGGGPSLNISGVSATSTSPTQEAVTWNTNQNSDSLANYGPTSNYGYTLYDGSFVKQHKVNLTNLTAGTLYHYQVTSKTSGGLSATSPDYTFTTQGTAPPPADTTPPTVSVTSPASGATVSGTVSISANASDNVGVAKVVFQLDGAVLATDTVSPYSYSWDTTAATNQSHTITATAYDAAGNQAAANESVTVSNAAPPSGGGGVTTTLGAITSPSVTTCGIINAAGTYTLQNDVSSPGTCFSIQTGGVTLDLNGHTVTYGTGPVVAVPNGSFENGATDWDFSGAPNATVKAGTFVNPVTLWDGGYSVAFAVSPGGALQTIKSSPFVLPGGRTYVISGMYINNLDGALKSTLEVDDAATGAPLASYTKTGLNSRGSQLTYPNSIKTTSDTTVVVKISVDSSLATKSGYMYWDDIKAQVGPAYGIAALQCWDVSQLKVTTWSGAVTSDAPCGGVAANGLHVTNGTIVQGAGVPFAGHAIELGQGEGGTAGMVEFDHLTIRLSAALKSQAVHSEISHLNIHDNYISSGVTTIERRDGFEGALIWNEYPNGEIIRNNTLVGGAQSGIALQGGTAPGEISGNDMSQSSYHTNDFAINLYGASNYQVFNNNIHPQSGRGIYVGAGATGDKLYNNTIRVIALPRNQEYNGCELSGTYGIQIEGSVSGVEAYGNNVTALSDQCMATALRFTGNPSTATANVHDNAFTASKSGSGSGIAGSMSFGENADGTGMIIKNNTFTGDTANVYVYWAGLTNWLFDSNTFAKGSTAVASYATLYGASAAIQSLNNVLLDEIYANGASFSSVNIPKVGYASATTTEYFAKWTLILKTVDSSGNPVSGASVSITDKTGGSVFSGATDTSGAATAILTEAHVYNTATTANVIDNFNPFTVSVTSSAGTAASTLNIDSPQTLTLTVK